MVTSENSKKVEFVSKTQSMEFCGLSTDTKPVRTFEGQAIGDNSLFKELDTGNIYYYDGGSWKLMGTGGSGSGGGAGLPAVTSEDNGKVLGVVNGAWNKTEATSESDFVIEATLDTESMGISNLSEDFDAIAAAAKAGKNVRIVAETPGTVDKVMYFAKLDLCVDDLDIAIFSGTVLTGEAMHIAIVTVAKSSDTGNTTAEVDYYPVSSDDDFPVEFTESNNTYNTETDIEDIIAAAEGGKRVFARLPMPGGITEMPLMYYSESQGIAIFTVIGIELGSNTPGMAVLFGAPASGVDRWDYYSPENTNGALISRVAATNDFKVIFTATSDGNGGTTITTETSISDIIAAVSAGKRVFGEYNTGMFIAQLPLTAYGRSESGTAICGFGGVIPDSGSSKSGMSSVFGSMATVGGQEVDTWYIYSE